MELRAEVMWQAISSNGLEFGEGLIEAPEAREDRYSAESNLRSLPLGRELEAALQEPKCTLCSTDSTIEDSKLSQDRRREQRKLGQPLYAAPSLLGTP